MQRAFVSASPRAGFLRQSKPQLSGFQRGGSAAPTPYQQLVPAAVGTDSHSEQQKNDAEKTTEKYGLEAGLLKVLTSKDEPGSETSPDRTKSKGQQAKDLLKRYGSAYLITSISFAIVSFALCYAAVSSGVDVGGLLARFGLQVTDTSEKVGTVAIAYAAHKALSPVRFPPTVALTPLVAQWLGQKRKTTDSSSE